MAPVHDRTIKIVVGYHASTPVPPLAHQRGLTHRFAVVLDTYRHDQEGMYFDAELFLAIVSEVIETVPHDSMEMIVREFPVEERVVLHSLDGYRDFLRALPSDDRLPPEQIRVFQEGRLNLLFSTEFWTFAGGPEPYHDSYTISVYTNEDESVLLAGKCRKVCKRLGAIVASEYWLDTQMPSDTTGESSHAGFLKRIIFWFQRNLGTTS